MENHLGELWNLFRFVVPGLLGSSEEFRKRFAVPIERDNCRESRCRLKRLIQPFLLRRTKTEVLSELPARSETVLEVEMSSAEVALYEALRLKAIEKIAEAASEDQSRGQQHLQVLAELTRLRLACCHPTLVGGDGIESAKLALFREKVGEIVAGQHKVLVFSQFVKHLTILRDELDSMGVSYQYLDGSTSMKRRKEAVESFQSGRRCLPYRPRALPRNRDGQDRRHRDIDHAVCRLGTGNGDDRWDGGSFHALEKGEGRHLQDLT
jgi:SNF2 family DNA or RNA helicase